MGETQLRVIFEVPVKLYMKAAWPSRTSGCGTGTDESHLPHLCALNTWPSWESPQQLSRGWYVDSGEDQRASQVFGKMNHNNKIKPCLRWVLYKEVRYSLASKLLQKVKVPSTVLSTNHSLAWPAMGRIPHWTVDAYFWAKRLTCSM